MGMPIVGYANALTATPGAEIEFKVSSETSTYQAQLVRLIHGDTNPAGPGLRVQAVESTVTGEYVGHEQLLTPGSFVRVPARPYFGTTGSFTIHLWVWPTTVTDPVQTLVSQGEVDAGGFALRLERGRVSFRCGTTSVTVSSPLEPRVWHSLAAVVDVDLGEVRLDVQPRHLTRASQRGVAQGSITPPARDDMEVLIAAEELGGPGRRNVGHFFNGKVDAPAIFAGPLADSEIATIRDAGEGEHLPRTIAAWDFSLDINAWIVTDTSGNDHHGYTVNKPTRGVTGRNWDGSETSWRHAPEQYGAIHFHDDDLDDAGWQTSFVLHVPGDLKSGIYAAHVWNERGEDYIPFAVRPPRGTTTAKIVFLMPTFSYLAYGNEQMLNSGVLGDTGDTHGYPSQPQDRYVVSNRLLSLYDRHRDGSGVCYSSRLRPIVNMRPGVVMHALNGRKGSPHQFNADLHLTDWLERLGYEFDVVTDEDLHHEGASLLEPYTVVITGTHSEYWSGEMLDAAQAYLRRGGRMMHMAGNGMYWVTQLDPESGTSIEIRRRGPSTRTWEPEPGEAHLSSTGELGGLWRFRGRAPQTWVGVGFTAETTGRGRGYRRQPDSEDPRVAFVFDGVEDGLIGDFPSLVNTWGAAGFEFDRFDPQLGSPAHALLLASAEGFDDDAQAVSEEIWLSDSAQGGSVNAKVRADMVLLEYPHGGAVFTPGSITWGACLSYDKYDNSVSRVTRNVLDAFLKEGLWPTVNGADR
jgi:N,N-dimethylformamidase